MLPFVIFAACATAPELPEPAAGHPASTDTAPAPARTVSTTLTMPAKAKPPTPKEP